MTLQEFLQFVSGSREIPVGGFQPRPTLHFSDDGLPSVSTCTLELTIPRGFSDEVTFINMMVYAIFNLPPKAFCCGANI